MALVTFESRRIKRKRKKNNGIILIFLLVFLISLVLIIYLYPIFRQEDINNTGQVQIYFMGKRVEAEPFYKERMLYLPFVFIKEHLDDSIYLDEKNKLLIITNNEAVYHFNIQSNEALYNLEPFYLKYQISLFDEEIYLPIELLQKIYNIKFFEDETEDIVCIADLRQPVQSGKVLKKTKLRMQPKIRSSWINEIQVNEDVNIFYEEDGWFWIETDDGRMGYVSQKNLELSNINEGVNPLINQFQPWKLQGEPIFLTWEFVLNKTAVPVKTKDLYGVNVLAPTWFELREDGVVENKADSKYIDWYHEQGKKVWPVFSNECKIDLTHSFLTDSKKRMDVIKKLVEYAAIFNIDGFGIDFEYMYMEDKDEYVQFIRELTPIMHMKGLTINIYIIFHSNSENWSLCYDHKALAESADYLTVMAYDQHTVLAGSVASLSWVENGVIRMLKDVPAEKLILGVPFYTRLWKEEPDENGKIKTTKQTFSMSQMEKWLSVNNPEKTIDDKAGQYYVEMKKGSAVYRMWIEDTYSLTKRIGIVKKYRLAGIAAWRKGLETEGTWTFLSSLLNKRW